jgi:hypothetical protein
VAQEVGEYFNSQTSGLATSEGQAKKTDY